RFEKALHTHITEGIYPVPFNPGRPCVIGKAARPLLADSEGFGSTLHRHMHITHHFTISHISAVVIHGMLYPVGIYFGAYGRYTGPVRMIDILQGAQIR